MAEHENSGASEAKAYLMGVDLGGTKILAAVTDVGGHILSRAKRATRPNLGPEGVINRIVLTVREAIDAVDLCPGDVAAMGVGAPAPVDPTAGIVYAAPNLPGWDEVPLGSRLEAVLRTPVYVDNDVNVGTLAEYKLGVGQGVRDMVGIFVGTGVGGGIIDDGRLRYGFRNSAGELGHMIMVPNGPLCGCGRHGCLEAVASRTALERDVRAGLAAGRTSIVGELLAKSRRGRLTSGLIAEAVTRQDPLMLDVLETAQFYLGLLVANVVNFFDPELFVFGGGVVEALGDQFLDPIRRVARQNFKQQLYAECVRIAAATLGDDAGVLGAAILAGQRSGLTQ